MAKDITTWARECVRCQLVKTGKLVKIQPAVIPTPSRRFSHLHVDLVGPLPVAAQGQKYILTIIDRSTRWVEAVPLADISASSVAEAMVHTWFSRFGLPDTITSDQGVQFTSAVWTALRNLHNIRRSLTTAYHPQANGMVERFHRQLKDALRSLGAAADWPAHLPWVLLGLRAAPKEDSGLSAAEMVYGVPLRLPVEPAVAVEASAADVAAARSSLPDSLPTRPLSYSEVLQGPPLHLARAEMVFVKAGAVRPPLSPLFQGPYRVLKKGPKTFSVEVGGRVEVISVDRLKAYTGEDTIPAAPPQRGRPPLLQDPPPSALGGGVCGGR